MAEQREGWYVSRKGERYGPYTWDDIVNYSREGRIGGKDLLWSQSTGEWMEASSISGLWLDSRDIGEVKQELRREGVSSPETQKSKIPWLIGSILTVMLMLVALILVFSGINDIRLGSATDDFSDGRDVEVEREDEQTPLEQVQELTVDETFDAQTTKLTSEKSRFEYQGVGLELQGAFLDKDVEIEVKKVKPITPPEDVKINAYRFTPREGDYHGLYRISIPYQAGEGDVWAGYFNEELNAWDGVEYEVDRENGRVIITTDHMSSFASFVGERPPFVIIENKGGRLATLDYHRRRAMNYAYDTNDYDYGAVIRDSFGSEMSPGGEAYDLATSVIGDWFKASGAILTFEGVAYSSTYLRGLNKRFGRAGLALSLTQLAVDYSRGNEKAVAIGAFNTAQGLAIGRWGTKALKISMIGVTAIDYSLNKLATEVIGGREEMWYKAYEFYYADEGARPMEEWHSRIKKLIEHAESPAHFGELLQAELNEYTWRFWLEDDHVIGDYQTKAQNHGFTGGAGLSEDLKREIADHYKSQLLLHTLEPLFRVLEKELRSEQLRDYLRELDGVRDELNKEVEFEIKEVVQGEEEPQYGGYLVRFGPLNDQASVTQWTGRMRDDGYARTRFTVIGHLSAGAPDEIRLYATEEDLANDNPTLVQAFEVDVPHTVVEILSEPEVIVEDEMQVSRALDAGVVMRAALDSLGHDTASLVDSQICTSESCTFSLNNHDDDTGSGDAFILGLKRGPGGSPSLPVEPDWRASYIEYIQEPTEFTHRGIDAFTYSYRRFNPQNGHAICSVEENLYLFGPDWHLMVKVHNYCEVKKEPGDYDAWCDPGETRSPYPAVDAILDEAVQRGMITLDEH